MSQAESAATAAREATAQAYSALAGTTPKAAIVFGSVSYSDFSTTQKAIVEVLGQPTVIAGGTSGGCVLGPDGIASRGISVVLLGGDGIEVVCETAELGSAELVEVVPAARRIAAAADAAARRGFEHVSCLVFAPGMNVDGDALVAAVRKGAGARAQLAGCLTGDELTMDRAKVFAGGELRDDRAVLVGLFTREHVGIATRHGWQPIGPSRVITRADGRRLIELDGRPALGVWFEDTQRAGFAVPFSPDALLSATKTRELSIFLANHFALGLEVKGGGNGDRHELVPRSPWTIFGNGDIGMSSSIGEGCRVRIVHASRNELLRAATDAASDAVLRAGGPLAGALVLACSARLVALGDDFKEETALITERVGAPIGGACVFGEIAKNERDVEAFYNTSTVVVAFPR